MPLAIQKAIILTRAGAWRLYRLYVEDVAVVGVLHDQWGEVGKAFIIPRSGADLSTEEIIDYCRGRLASYKWPREIVFCKDFPRTPLGKVKKRLLVP